MFSVILVLAALAVLGAEGNGALPTCPDLPGVCQNPEIFCEGYYNLALCEEPTQLCCKESIRTLGYNGKRLGAGKYLGPCAAKFAEVTHTLETSLYPRLGLELPNCDENGDYLGMQTIGSVAYCVTKDGTRLNYTVNIWETGDNMDCQCARDQYDYEQLGIIGLFFNCEPNGNYAPVQCRGSVCYCADNKGQQVWTKTVPIGEQDKLEC